MKFIAYKKPFPHIIGHNIFNKIDKKEIIDEMYWIYESGFMSDDTQSAKKVVDGQEISKSKKNGMFLLDIYDQIEMSKIFLNMGNLLMKLNDYINKNETDFLYEKYFEKISIVNYLLNFYSDGDYYESHHDKCLFTLVWYHWKEKNQFSGGKLFFEEYNYTFECDDNSFIIFPSVLEHEVTLIKKNDGVGDDEKTNGRYSSTLFLKLH